MEFSTRQRPFNIDNFTIYDVRYAIQYNDARFISANNIEDLKVLCKSEIGKELDEKLLQDSTALHDSNELKILLHVSDRMYHVLLDTIPLILKINKLYPEAKFVLYLRGEVDSEKTNIFHKCLVDVLNAIGAKYFLIHIGFSNYHSPVYKISNFIYLDLVRFNIHWALSLLDVQEAADLIKKIYLKPGRSSSTKRKVYLARPSSMREFGAPLYTEDGSYGDDARIYEEDRLKEFFLSKGYEVIAPETEFSSFAEQVQFMSEVGVLAAVSSSGLANSLFMEPGGRVIEIMAEVVTPRMILPDGRLTTNQALPKEYFPLSFIMGHSHVMIPTNRDSIAAIEVLRRHQEF